MLIKIILCALIGCLPSFLVHAQPTCNTVRFADVGWVDVTATTVFTSSLLKQKGWSTQIQTLSVPVAFMGMKNKDIDVFLGNWMPTQKTMVEPYIKDGSVVSIAQNLDNAQYTLAVPSHVYDAGVRSAEDIHRYADRFKHRIYGIEAGNDGNLTVLNMIKNNTYGLAGFQLIESSEQGMLSEVQKKIHEKSWVVFLAWKPHPMNDLIAIKYLDDPQHMWGENGGKASVHTLVSKDFHTRCPTVTHALKNIFFSMPLENTLMDFMLNQKMPAEDAVLYYFKTHPKEHQEWLAKIPQAPIDYFHTNPTKNSLSSTRPFGNAVSYAINTINKHVSSYSRWCSLKIEYGIQQSVGWLNQIPYWAIACLFAAVVYGIHRSLLLTSGVFIGLFFIYHTGFWTASIETVVLVVLSSVVSLSIGIPLGIACAHAPRFYNLLRPLLDMMQTIPTFVYLIPSLMLFGLGVVPGIVSTVVFACPTSIRLMHQCLTHMPSEYNDVSKSLGASFWQHLWHVEMPFSIPTLWAAVNQTLMLGLSMVVISALVGSGGLGVAVVRSLNTVDIATGFEAGLAIVILAMIMDRTLCQPSKTGL